MRRLASLALAFTACATQSPPTPATPQQKTFVRSISDPQDDGTGRPVAYPMGPNGAPILTNTHDSRVIATK